MAQLVTINVAQLVTIKMAKRGPVSNLTAGIYTYLALDRFAAYILTKNFIFPQFYSKNAQKKLYLKTCKFYLFLGGGLFG